MGGVATRSTKSRVGVEESAHSAEVQLLIGERERERERE